MNPRWAVSAWVAWRFVRKAPARSALIAILVALPVVAGTFVAVTIRTAELSPAQAAQRFIGNADAVAVVTPYPRLDPATSFVGFAGGFASEPGQVTSSGEGQRRSGAVDLPALLPPGARATPAGWQRYVGVTAGDRRAAVTANLLDLTDPTTHGMYDVQTGRAPHAGEVALTTHLAGRLHVGVGAAVDVSGAAARVAAIVRDPSSLSTDQVVGPAASLGGMASFPGRFAPQDLTWLISYPGHRASDLHAELAARGVIYETRAQWERPPAALTASVHVNSQERAILGSIIGFGLAEIVLLAGTAFAVGVRRQTRELGLLRAIGGDERDVRRVILLQGLVLGLAGAIVGVALGFTAFLATRGSLERLADQAFGPLDAHPGEILVVASVGVAAAVLAAVIPARTSARSSVLDMLRVRFGIGAGKVAMPRWAYAALLGGPLLIVAAAVGWHHASGGLVGASSATVGGVVAAVASSSPDDGQWTGLISVGAAITLAGIARACPSLVSGLGRRVGRLPLSLRLAARDAARHRHRTAPAVAAVATVVAGAALVLLMLSSTEIRDRHTYQPLYPLGTVGVSLDQRHVTEAELTAATRDVATRFGGGPGALVRRAVLEGAGPNDDIGVHQPGCDNRTTSCDIGSVAVATPNLVAVLTGHELPPVDASLGAGRAVVLDPTVVQAGRVALDEVRMRHNRFRTTSVTLPAVVIAASGYPDVPQVIVSPASAHAHHWSSVSMYGLVRPRHLPSQATADRVAAAVGNDTNVYVERGYHSGIGVALLALLGGAALAVLVGTSIAVALAMTESRPDMATFAAVGASPRRRRVLAMGQAATVGSLGTVLGFALGLFVGIALLQGSTSYPFTLPLRWLALLLVSAPLLAVVVAGAATRSTVPMTRRLG